MEIFWPRPWRPSFARPEEREDAVSVATRVFDAEYRWLTKKLIPHLERALENEDERRTDQKTRFAVPTTQNLKAFVEKLEGIVSSGVGADAKNMPFRLRSLCSDFRLKAAKEQEDTLGDGAVVTGAPDYFFADPFVRGDSPEKTMTSSPSLLE